MYIFYTISKRRVQKNVSKEHACLFVCLLTFLYFPINLKYHMLPDYFNVSLGIRKMMR